MTHCRITQAPLIIINYNNLLYRAARYREIKRAEYRLRAFSRARTMMHLVSGVCIDRAIARNERRRMSDKERRTGDGREGGKKERNYFVQ